MDNVFSATVTDYRFQLSTLDDVVRCSNYVEAMGRECVWFCYIADLSEGVGDEWTSVQAPNMTDFTDSISQANGTTNDNNSGSTDTSGTGASGTGNAPTASYSGGQFGRLAHHRIRRKPPSQRQRRQRQRKRRQFQSGQLKPQRRHRPTTF